MKACLDLGVAPGSDPHRLDDRVGPGHLRLHVVLDLAPQFGDPLAAVGLHNDLRIGRGYLARVVDQGETLVRSADHRRGLLDALQSAQEFTHAQRVLARRADITALDLPDVDEEHRGVGFGEKRPLDAAKADECHDEQAHDHRDGEHAPADRECEQTAEDREQRTAVGITLRPFAGLAGLEQQGAE